MTEQPSERAAIEEVALAWLDERIAHHAALHAKAIKEATFFRAEAVEWPCWGDLARRWQKDADFNHERAALLTTLRDIARDRGEWRTQHENLLSVRQSDLALLAAIRAQDGRDG